MGASSRRMATFSDPDSALPGPARRHDPERDTLDKVDACFRTQRRVAVAAFALFIGVTLALPALAVVVHWGAGTPVFGGMSLSFAMAALGIYAFLFVLALAMGHVANTLEDVMLGEEEEDPAT